MLRCRLTLCSKTQQGRSPGHETSSRGRGSICRNRNTRHQQQTGRRQREAARQIGSTSLCFEISALLCIDIEAEGTKSRNVVLKNSDDLSLILFLESDLLTSSLFPQHVFICRGKETRAGACCFMKPERPARPGRRRPAEWRSGGHSHRSPGRAPESDNLVPALAAAHARPANPSGRQRPAAP